MPARVSRAYQDIVIINLKKSRNGGGGGSKSSNRFLYVVIGVLLAILLLGIGYAACIRAGLLPPPDTTCCFGVLEFDFDFETPIADQ